MEQICGVMATSGRAVPGVSTTSTCPWRWRDARWMYDRARELGAPFMAGSSVPLLWRNPWLEHDGDDLRETVTIGSLGTGGLRNPRPRADAGDGRAPPGG